MCGGCFWPWSVTGSREGPGTLGSSVISCALEGQGPPARQGRLHPPAALTLPDGPIVKMGRPRPEGEEKTWASRTWAGVEAPGSHALSAV